MRKSRRATSTRSSGSRSKRKACNNELRQYLDRYVVVDTTSPFVFIGKLRQVSEDFVTLADVDVHDRRESPSSNEKYIMDSKKHGVRANRTLVHIRQREVISISALDDIIVY